MGDIHDLEKVSLLDNSGHDEDHSRSSRVSCRWRRFRTLVVLGALYSVYALAVRVVIFALGPGHHGGPGHDRSWAYGAAWKHQSALGSPEKVEELYL